MRNIIIALSIIAIIYFFSTQYQLDVLMDGEAPFVGSSNSGYSDIDPEESFATSVSDFSSPGLITVVEFHDEACASCRKMIGYYDRLLKIRPDVSIKLIHMTKGQYRHWGKKFGLDVPSIPFTVLLNKKGEIMAADDGRKNDGYDLLRKWFDAEINRDR